MKPQVLVVDDEQTTALGLTTLLALNDIESAGAFDRLSARPTSVCMRAKKKLRLALAA